MKRFLVLLLFACGSSTTQDTNDAGTIVPGIDASKDSTTVINDAGVTACSGKLLQPLDNTWTIVSKDTNRTANVHVPKSYDPTKGAPMSASMVVPTPA